MQTESRAIMPPAGPLNLLNIPEDVLQNMILIPSLSSKHLPWMSNLGYAPESWYHRHGWPGALSRAVQKANAERPWDTCRDIRKLFSAGAQCFAMKLGSSSSMAMALHLFKTRTSKSPLHLICVSSRSGPVRAVSQTDTEPLLQAARELGGAPCVHGLELGCGLHIHLQNVHAAFPNLRTLVLDNPRVSLESPAQAGRLAQVATITGLRTLSLHFFASSVPELIYLTALKSLGTLNMFCQTTEAASEQDYHHLFTMAAQLSQLNRLCVSLSHGCDTGSSSLMQVLSCTSSLKQLRIDSLSISGFYTLLRHAPATLTALWVTVKTGPWAWGAMSSWPAFPVLQQNTLPNLEGLTIVGPPGILLCFATLESVAKLRLIPELPHVFTPDIYHVHIDVSCLSLPTFKGVVALLSKCPAISSGTSHMTVKLNPLNVSLPDPASIPTPADPSVVMLASLPPCVTALEANLLQLPEFASGSALLSSIADTLGQGLLEVTLELHVWHLPVVASGLFTTSGQLTLPKLKVLRLAFPDDGPPRAAEVFRTFCMKLKALLLRIEIQFEHWIALRCAEVQGGLTADGAAKLSVALGEFSGRANMCVIEAEEPA